MVSISKTEQESLSEGTGFGTTLRYRLGRYVLIGVPLTILVIWTTVPMLWALLASFKEPLEIYESNTFLPSNPSLDAYKTVLSMRGFDSLDVQ